MPPSTHYLNLLNLNQTGEQLPSDEYTEEDISKQLELFTNSNFLDTEPFFNQPFDAAAFDGSRLQSQPTDAHFPNLQRQNSITATQSRTGRPGYDAPSTQTKNAQQPHIGNHALTNIDYLHQFNPESYTGPLGSKRSSEDAELNYHETPASSEAGDDRKSAGRSLDDEDKRRRNTAASARFRVKKKQREQALQESAKAMTDKNNALESRVRELELENKWLRSLLKPVSAEQSQSVLASL